MQLPKTAKKIRGSYDWIDIDGNIYGNRYKYKSSTTFKKVQYKSKSGYMYCGINYINGEHKKKRVHRIVAETFIPNPNNYLVVGHKNNVKSDNRVENLYWTTVQENTQKAYDDGLAHNDNGFDDSQSKPVKMYNTYTNELIQEFGSIRIASRITNIPKTTISRQAKYKRPVRKPFYFRYSDDESLLVKCQLIGKYSYDTDELLEIFYNVNEASKRTGVPAKTISSQCANGKPKRKYCQVYFQRIRK